MVVPGVMNNFIATFMDTSLVTVVSMYDLTGALTIPVELTRARSGVPYDVTITGEGGPIRTELDGRTFQDGILLGARVNALSRATEDFKRAIAAFLALAYFTRERDRARAQLAHQHAVQPAAMAPVEQLEGAGIAHGGEHQVLVANVAHGAQQVDRKSVV